MEFHSYRHISGMPVVTVSSEHPSRPHTVSTVFSFFLRKERSSIHMITREKRLDLELILWV